MIAQIARRTAWCVAYLALLSHVDPLTAFAQVSPSEDSAANEGIQIYQRSFFDRFNPQSARDLIDRLPGFALDSGAGTLRGFGNSAGNVLIDGERPSSKVGGIQDALARIPADRVERIEVIRGSAGSTEAAGQAVVANIIRSTSERAASWETRLERAADASFNRAGEFAYARRFGAWDISTTVNALWEQKPLVGSRVSRDGANRLGSTRREDVSSVLARRFVSSEATVPLSGGKLTITGRFGSGDIFRDTERLGFDGRFPDSAPDERFLIDVGSTSVDHELGIDWSRTLGGDWSIKLLSLGSYRDRFVDQAVTTERPLDQLQTASFFDALEDKYETVFRSTVSRVGDHRFKPEFGSEVAYNRLDSLLRLRSEENDRVTVIELPASDVVVDELRTELFANVIWSAAPKLTVETGIGIEASEITVIGDADSRQRFAFAKPFATLIVDAQPGLQFRLGARRTVGQVRFSDFAASAVAEDDRFLGGNPELGPDQTNRLSFTTDVRFKQGGALNLELFHEWRADVLEQVLLPSGASGTANAGVARVWGLASNAALPLAPLIPGGLFEVEVKSFDSQFGDPLTGETRIVSGLYTPLFLAEFRQDLTDRRFSWGVTYSGASEQSTFFTDEKSVSEFGDAWTVFVETTRFWGTRTNLALRNVGAVRSHRERLFFDSDRSGPFSGSETIDQERGMYITLTVSGQFYR